jgi:hypothetical protein
VLSPPPQPVKATVASTIEPHAKNVRRLPLVIAESTSKKWETKTNKKGADEKKPPADGLSADGLWTHLGLQCVLG